MKRCALIALAACAAPAPPRVDGAPKLAVLFVIDQLPEWAFVQQRPGSVTARWSKVAGRGAKAVSVSLKDRSAVLPLGHRGLAIWFDAASASWTTDRLIGTRGTGVRCDRADMGSALGSS